MNNDEFEKVIRQQVPEEYHEHNEIPMPGYVEPKGFPWIYVLICVALFGAGFVAGYGTTWDIFEPGVAWNLCR